MLLINSYFFLKINSRQPNVLAIEHTYNMKVKSKIHKNRVEIKKKFNLKTHT